MDGIDPDGELTEFRPWTEFERSPRPAWQPVAGVALAVALALIGLIVWRGYAGQGAPTQGAAVPQAPLTEGPLTEGPLTEGAAPQREAGPQSDIGPQTDGGPHADPPVLLSEADLLGSGGGTSDLVILGLAEEAVIEHFAGLSEGEIASKSYVEWARSVGLEWDGERAIVAVRFSAVVLADIPWRLPVRTVELTMHLRDDQWVIDQPPRLRQDGTAVRWDTVAFGEVPPSLRAEFEAEGWTVTGGREREGGWDVAVTDATGASLVVFAEYDGPE